MGVLNIRGCGGLILGGGDEIVFVGSDYQPIRRRSPGVGVGILQQAIVHGSLNYRQADDLPNRRHIYRDKHNDNSALAWRCETEMRPNRICRD